jgi:class 3 adenylate cyclase
MGDGLLATFNDPLQALRAVHDARARMADEPECVRFRFASLCTPGP